jgi:hypothetical protein
MTFISLIWVINLNVFLHHTTVGSIKVGAMFDFVFAPAANPVTQCLLQTGHSNIWIYGTIIQLIIL